MRKLTTAVLVLMVAFALAGTACKDGRKTTVSPTATPGGSAQGGIPDVTGEPTVTDSGLQIIDITVGDGAEATAASTVTVHYSGWLEDGTLFDSSVGGEPISFQLSGLIAGWQEGIPGMKAGGKRRLIVPSDLGYGETGRGQIPPNATLVFDIELLDAQ